MCGELFSLVVDVVICSALLVSFPCVFMNSIIDNKDIQKKIQLATLWSHHGPEPLFSLSSVILNRRSGLLGLIFGRRSSLVTNGLNGHSNLNNEVHHFSLPSSPFIEAIDSHYESSNQIAELGVRPRVENIDSKSPC